MAIRTLQYLKTKFETGDLPTQADFTDLIDSCYNGLTALSGSGEDANLLLSYITNFNYFDTVLATLTANSFVGTSYDNPLYTSTNLSLTADQINVNLNEVEALIYRSNTLLNVLTSQQTTVNLDVSAINVNTDQVERLISTSNTFLNALTGQINTLQTSVSTTNPRLSSIDVKLTTLIDQTDSIEEYIDQVEGYLLNIRNNTNNIPSQNSQLTRTVQLSSGLYCDNLYIWSIQGTSFAGYDQYLQIRETNGDLLFTQKIKANENFEFNFWPNGSGAITGTGFDTYIQNSLTPFTHTPGNNDLYLFVTGKSAISIPGGP